MSAMSSGKVAMLDVRRRVLERPRISSGENARPSMRGAPCGREADPASSRRSRPRSAGQGGFPGTGAVVVAVLMAPAMVDVSDGPPSRAWDRQRASVGSRDGAQVPARPCAHLRRTSAAMSAAPTLDDELASGPLVGAVLFAGEHKCQRACRAAQAGQSRPLGLISQIASREAAA
jgi:hypothetical protein